LKIPLEETIAGGYRFLFTNIVSVIGTLWLPYLLLAAVGVACGYVVLPQGFFEGNLSHFDISVLWQPQAHAARALFFATNLIVAAMVAVNLMRHALGQKQTITWAFFSLGAPVWRMTGAILIAVVLLVLLAVLLAVIGVAAGYAAFQRLEPAGAIGAVVLTGAVLLLVLAYCFARLLFFLPAVVVAEERIGLGRSWALGRGNFGRMVIVWLLIAVPVWFVAGIVVQSTILPIILSEASQLPRHPTAQQMEPLFRSVVYALPVVVPVMIAAGIAIRAFMAGAIGTAYKAVTAPKEDSE
jgi:hypothetical protein